MRISKAIGCIAVFVGEAVSASVDQTTSVLQGLVVLTSNSATTVHDISKLRKDMGHSKGYHEFIHNAEKNPKNINALLGDVNAALTGADAVAVALQTPASVPGSSAVAVGSSSGDAVDAVGGTTAGDESSESTRILNFVAGSVEKIEAMTTTLGKIDSDVSAHNLDAAVQVLKEEFLPEIASLTNAAIVMIPPESSIAIANKWRDALIKINNLSIQFATGTVTQDTIVQFKDQTVTLLGQLSGYPKFAQSLIGQNINSAPAPNASTAALQRQAAGLAVTCTCNFGWWMFNSCCSGSTANVAAPVPPQPSSTNGATTSGTADEPLLTEEVEKALKLAMFIDNTVHTVESLVRQVKQLHGDKTAWKNFEWRLVIALLQMLNTAAAEETFGDVYALLKTHSHDIGSLIVNAATSTTEAGLEGAVEQLLTQLQSQLVAARPTNV